RPAGRITDRLVEEIHSASLCVADLTGGKPNVMWEVGYAMALGKPTIIITQESGELPFDIRVMETIHYDRNHLENTLRQPLQRATIDTLSSCSRTTTKEKNSGLAFHTELVQGLLDQIRELRNIVEHAVRTWNPTPEQERAPKITHDDIKELEGALV